MTTATQTRAEFLKSAERSEVSANATLAFRWGDAAGDTTQSSLLINQSDTATELARQMTLLSSVFAEDSVLLEGLFFDLEGQTVRIDYTAPANRDVAGNWFDGAASVDLLVTKARPDPGSGTTLVQGFIQL
jgi:hypothetical protein